MKTCYWQWLPVCVALVCLPSCKKDPPMPPAAIHPVPSDAQMRWHEMEQNAFIHFTTNTFTNLEWGLGNESPEIFEPSDFDADQWISVLKETGFKGVILTCKHHDGFCLWPSMYTDHSVKSSPYKNGEGDIVKDVADACRRHDLKFGVYLSPWDRNHPQYGKPEYIQYYRDQLKELFTQYGPVFEMWFDGANGGDGYYGGKHEVRKIDGSTYYDWPTTLRMVADWQSDVIFFSDAGPGVRWCGNERGVGGETNWNMITPDTLYAGKPGIGELLNTGSENGTHWIPAEVNTSIRPGWFYHPEEDSLVKSPEKLFEIYLTSVGRGSTLLLNIPPDKRGRLHENDIQALREWNELKNERFKTNLAASASATASHVRGNSSDYDGHRATDGDPETYWATDDAITAASLEIDLESPSTVRYIVMQEPIRLGQRVKKFSIELWQNGEWKKVEEGSTIGYKRIIPIEPAETSKVRLTIQESRACPLISGIEVY